VALFHANNRLKPSAPRTIGSLMWPHKVTQVGLQAKICTLLVVYMICSVCPSFNASFSDNRSFWTDTILNNF